MFGGKLATLAAACRTSSLKQNTKFRLSQFATRSFAVSQLAARGLCLKLRDVQECNKSKKSRAHFVVSKISVSRRYYFIWIKSFPFYFILLWKRTPFSRAGIFPTRLLVVWATELKYSLQRVSKHTVTRTRFKLGKTFLTPTQATHTYTHTLSCDVNLT